MSQTGAGVTSGDSHKYGLNPEPNEHVFCYLKSFAKVPVLTIAEKWHGVYPILGKTIVNVLSSAGMTLSFAC